MFAMFLHEYLSSDEMCIMFRVELHHRMTHNYILSSHVFHTDPNPMAVIGKSI